MFFNISTAIDSRFPNNYQFDNLWINCDDGWKIQGKTFYKGYCDNDCYLIVTDSAIQIKNTGLRSFPLWYQDGAVNNIEPLANQAWVDNLVEIDQQGTVCTSKVQVDYSVPNRTITTADAKRQIKLILDQKLKSVPARLKLFCSGGLDTLLLYGMLSQQHSFDLVTDEHYESNNFTDNNKQLLNNFWAYKQIHHWNDPTWLATGSHGDEYFLRGPATIAMLTAWHGINFGELLADNPNCYHYYYFNKYSDLWHNTWADRQKLKEEYPTIELLHCQIMNILINDHQHWHLGNTLTWTPFKDIEIARILLQCDINDLLPQFIDGRLSKDLIIDYNDNIIDYLSQYKNYNKNENLSKLFEYHAKLAK